MKQKGILRRVARQTVLNGSPVYIIYTLIRFSICLQNIIYLYFNLFLVGFSAQEKDGITHFKTNSADQSLQASPRIDLSSFSRQMQLLIFIFLNHP